jgi:WD40 repeat protein/DNA-binding SARP family transcriptional activator/energy-coupling factor transporter ATP-binding protein EcfA2
VEIAILGPLHVEPLHGSLGPRDRVVLEALALRAGEQVGADRLAEALWGDEPPSSWNKVVQGCIVRLRKALGQDAIGTGRAGYRLTVPLDAIDAKRFERLVQRGRELATMGEPERAAHVLEEALGLWRGAALTELEEWDPGRIERQRLAELRLEAEEEQLDAALRAGLHRDVVATARARVEEAPTRERRWQLLALAQYQAGQQGQALRTISEAGAVLRRELGLEPGPALLALEQAILRQDTSLAPPDALPESSATCPWPGLLSYDIDDADLYFGREQELSTCLQRLAGDGVLAVVGPSGSGKSSFVRAGVAAALRRQGGRVVVVTPSGARPVDVLSAVQGSGPTPVLVVDQCEEVLTPRAEVAERQAFLSALVEHAERGPLVVAIRADRLADLTEHPGLARLVERGLFLLGPLPEVELRAAIERPAWRAALLLEPGLVDLVVREVHGEPGALPLMSHALRETWVRREGRTLTVEAYRITGGIRGAVARSAEAVYRDVGARQQRRLRDLMLRLVTPTEGGEPVRSKVPRRLLAADAEHDELVERLVGARLVTSDDGVVEVAHEALVRAWPRLRGWLDDDVEGLRIFAHLTAAADSWASMGRPTSELYRGARLARALEWRERAAPELTAAERSFLDESSALEAADLQAAQEQIRRERRSVRRLRRLVAGVAALALVAGVASLIAVDQRDRADGEAQVAEARRIAAQALVERGQDRALLLAVEAVHLWDSPETRASLLATIERSPRAAAIIAGPGPRLLNVTAAPGAERVTVVDHWDDVTLYDVASRQALASVGEEETSFRTPAFSPDGRRIAVSRSDTSCWFSPECGRYGVDVLDARDLRPTGTTYAGLGLPAADIAYSPDGELIAAVPPFAWAPSTGNVAVWRVDQPDEPLLRLTVPDLGVDLRRSPDHAPPGWVHFSPDGTRLYAGGAGPTVAFDLATGEAVRTFEGVGAMALSPNGRRIAIGAANTVTLHDTATGERLVELDGHDQLVTAAAFSPDGRVLATASNDEAVVLWDGTTGQRIDRLEGHAGAVEGVAFSPDGTTVYSAASDRSLIAWDLRGSRGLRRQLAEPSLSEPASNVVLLSPAGDGVALFAEGVRVLDLESGRARPLAVAPDTVAWGAYSPDGERLVTVGFDGATTLWATSDGRRLGAAPGRGEENLGAVAFTPDGTAVVVADADGTVTRLDGRTLEERASTEVGIEPHAVRTAPDGLAAVMTPGPGPDGGADVVIADLDRRSVRRRVHVPVALPRTAFSADGRRYAAGGFDGRLAVVDVERGTWTGPHDPVHAGPISWVAFSPDGSTLASLGFDGQLVLADAETGTPRARFRPGAANLAAGLGFAPDGHTVLVAYKDGAVVSFDTDPDAWVRHACTVAGRNLTSDEWRDAFGDRPYRETCPGR